MNNRNDYHWTGPFLWINSYTIWKGKEFVMEADDEEHAIRLVDDFNSKNAAPKETND